jgi:hypothetical protein
MAAAFSIDATHGKFGALGGATLRLVAAAALTLVAGVSLAQGPAQGPPKQILLTEKQVENYIAAQKDMTALAEQQQKQKAAPKGPDPKVQAQFEAVAKKYGFASLDEYGAVAAQVGLVLTGIDPETKAFAEPPEALKKQIEEVKADKNMPAKDKQLALKELTEALKGAQPIQHKENIELVKKYYDKLEASVK